MERTIKPDEDEEAERIPYFAYSSFNRKGGKTHPVVIRRRNRALSMWAEMKTVEEIAETLDIAECTVRAYIRRARRANDELARRPLGWETRIKMRKELRKANIARMKEAGLDAKEIARRLGVHVRLVQMRLRELGNG